MTIINRLRSKKNYSGKKKKEKKVAHPLLVWSERTTTAQEQRQNKKKVCTTHTDFTHLAIKVPKENLNVDIQYAS